MSSLERKKIKLDLKRIFYGSSLFILLVALNLLLRTIRFGGFDFNYSIFYIFQARDLARAQELLQGNLIFFGPELTGGGNSPGPFYYFLLLPPLYLGLGWVGTWWWMQILAALGGALGGYFFRLKTGIAGAIFWTILYSFSVPGIQVGRQFLNPGFISLFLVLIIIFILKAFEESSSDSERGRFFVAACFICGLVIQIHVSSIVFFLVLIALQAFSKRIGLLSIKRKSFFSGMAAFIFLLVPFGVWQILKKYGIEIGQASIPAGKVTNSLPSLLASFKNIPLASEYDFFTLSFKKIFFEVSPILLIVIGLKAFDRWKFGSQRQDLLTSKNRTMIKIALIFLLFSFLPFSFYFFVPQGMRYAVPFGVSMLFLTVLVSQDYLKEKSNIAKFNFACLIFLSISFMNHFKIEKSVAEYLLSAEGYFAFSALAILIGYGLFSSRNKREIVISIVLVALLSQSQFVAENKFLKEIYKGVKMTNFLQWKIIWTKIYQETGWTYKEAINRIYFVNHHIEQDPEAPYKIIINQMSPNSTSGSDLPDGYFVAIDKPRDQEAMEWLLKQTLQEDVKTALLTKNIVLGKNKPAMEGLIVPYFIKNKEIFPKSIHNNGVGYNQLPEERLFQNRKIVSGVEKLTAHKFLFRWNECPDNNRYCDTGAIVEIQKEKKDELKLKVTIIGLPLSQSSSWINPTWTQAWILPYLEIKCAGQIKKINLISSIGYNRKYDVAIQSFRYPAGNHSILAPFEKTFHISCQRSQLAEISIGRTSSQVVQEPDFIVLPGQKLTYHF